MVTVAFHSSVGRPNKQRLFIMEAFKWAPTGFGSWVVNRDKAMVKLWENKMYAHEVAAKLIKEKKQELEDGNSRRDVLSLLGWSFAAPMKPNEH